MLLLALPAASAQPRGGAEPQTLTAGAMARSGLTRVSDLFWFLNGWETASLGGYAPRPSAVGMPGAPLLVVDGAPMEGGPFGQPPLPVLPVHLGQVRAAEASPAPALVAGRLAPDGSARLRLRKPPAGLEARGAFSVGNEIGDPGPFRSTDRRVLNVDRIGPQYFAEASRGGPRLGAQLSLQALRHYTTDRAIRARTENAQDTLDGPPLKQLVAGRLALRADSLLLPGRHRLTAHYAALRALPFFETLGYEVPARRRHVQASLRGTVPASSGGAGQRFGYRLGYRRATMASAPSRFRRPIRDALLFDWSEDHLSGHAGLGGVALPGGLPGTMRLVLSADYTHARAAATRLDDPDVLTARAYAELAPAFPEAAVRPRLALLLSQTDGQIGGGALLSATWPFEARRLGGHGNADYSATARLAYVRRPYAAGGSFWYWLGQGLRPPQAPAGRVAVPASFPASRRLTADLRLERAFGGGGGHLALELSARHFRGLSLPLADFDFGPLALPSYAPPGGTLVPDTRLLTGAAGQTVRVAVEGERAFPAGLRHQVRYDLFAHRAGGDGARRRAFDQRFQRTPHQRLRYTAQLAVGGRFSLEGRVMARSAERWTAYRRVARAGGNAYRSWLPTCARVDLTATKRFWKNHLRARLALRNALDTPLRTHPAGPVERLALFVSLEANL